MVIDKKKLGQFINTIHNMECVVEVYFDQDKNEINEVKCLNYNRYKVYNYAFADYTDSIKRYNLEIPNGN